MSSPYAPVGVGYYDPPPSNKKAILGFMMLMIMIGFGGLVYLLVTRDYVASSDAGGSGSKRGSSSRKKRKPPGSEEIKNTDTSKPPSAGVAGTGALITAANTAKAVTMPHKSGPVRIKHVMGHTYSYQAGSKKIDITIIDHGTVRYKYEDTTSKCVNQQDVGVEWSQQDSTPDLILLINKDVDGNMVFIKDDDVNGLEMTWNIDYRKCDIKFKDWCEKNVLQHVKDLVITKGAGVVNLNPPVTGGPYRVKYSDLINRNFTARDSKGAVDFQFYKVPSYSGEVSWVYRDETNINDNFDISAISKIVGCEYRPDSLTLQVNGLLESTGIYYPFPALSPVKFVWTSKNGGTMTWKHPTNGDDSTRAMTFTCFEHLGNCAFDSSCAKVQCEAELPAFQAAVAAEGQQGDTFRVHVFNERDMDEKTCQYTYHHIYRSGDKALWKGQGHFRLNESTCDWNLDRYWTTACSFGNC